MKLRPSHCLFVRSQDGRSAHYLIAHPAQLGEPAGHGTVETSPLDTLAAVEYNLRVHVRETYPELWEWLEFHGGHKLGTEDLTRVYGEVPAESAILRAAEEELVRRDAAPWL